MILVKLAAAALVINVAAASAVGPSTDDRVSAKQKGASAQAYVDVATDCVAHAVAADPRFRRDNPTLKLGELIDDAMPKCGKPVRAMIDAFDLYFGAGMG